MFGDEDEEEDDGDEDDQTGEGALPTRQRLHVRQDGLVGREELGQPLLLRLSSQKNLFFGQEESRHCGFLPGGGIVISLGLGTVTMKETSIYVRHR